MEKWLAVALWAAASAAQAVLVTDNFNRANTVFTNEVGATIGAGYALTQLGGDRQAQARILTNQIQLTQTTGGTANANNIVLRYTGLELANAGPEESFRVEGDIRSANSVAASLLYGLAFNYQSDGSFYVARINTGNAANILQFVRFNSAGVASSFHSAANSQMLAISSLYNLVVESSGAGVFSYTLSGANIDGGVLSGTATDTVLKLEGGFAGFYSTGANTSILFDNLSIEVIPEPATLGLVGFVAAAAFGVRRFMLL